jgi:hypothetical protein
MSGLHPEHDELLGALRGETCDDAARSRMREKLAAAGVLSASAAAAGTASAVAHAAPAASGAKVGLFKALTATKLLGGGALLAVGTAVVVTLSSPAERPVAPATPPRTEAAPAPVVAPVVEVPAEVEGESESEAQEVERAPARKRTRAATRAEKSALARESALLTGAARRLHAGDLEGAKRLLDEHEHSFPAGVLRTERELARKRVESELRARGAP